MSLGTTFRQAREEKGQTISQVAEATRMMTQIVEDLERDDFRRIAAPIYGRGFIKLYAEHLGLDSEPLIREFMEIYTGSRPPQVVRRAEATADSGSVGQLDSEAVAPSDSPTVQPPDRPTARPPDRPTVPLSSEPDLFSVAAGRSEVVRSVADPAQPGEAMPPRVRPAASAQAEAHPPSSGESTFRRIPAKLRVAGSDDAERPGRGRAGDWFLPHGTPAVIGVVAAVILLLLLAGAVALSRKGGKARHAKPAPIKVERVLPPNKPYFE